MDIDHQNRHSQPFVLVIYHFAPQSCFVSRWRAHSWKKAVRVAEHCRGRLQMCRWALDSRGCPISPASVSTLMRIPSTDSGSFITAYQRPTSSSSSSASYPAPPQQSGAHQQQQQQDRVASRSPEHSRSNMMGRSYHEEYRSAHHQRGVSDMHDSRDVEDRNASHTNRRWMEDQQRSFAPPSDRGPYPRQQTQPPSQQPGPYSHPSSPSQRPRTPPYQQQFGHHRPSRWDASQSGPMSAPPSMVPRIHPNAPPASSATANSASSSLSQSGSLSQHNTSPILPGLMRGSKNHSRLPSWGPHSSTNASNLPTRTDGASVGHSSATAGGGSSNGGHNTTSGSLPPPVLPYRGQSVGLGDPFTRSDLASQGEKRKRPASDSPPNNGAATTGSTAPAPGQQVSPTLRGDPMSMSSILGPSSRNGEMDKRRRLEGGIPSSSSYGSSVKIEGGIAAPGTNNPSTKFNVSTINLGGSPATNLARRKWSGPIAEQAAQQAAAWRAQEQRWGSSRSPKIGISALGAEQRQTPPIGAVPSKGDNSPARGDGHKRQRSDGYPGVQGSPLNRSVPLRAHSPITQTRQPRSTESSPTGYHQPLEAMSRASNSPSKPFNHSKSGGSFFRPASPPPSSAQQMMSYQQHHHQQQQQQHHQTQHHPVSGLDRSVHAYGQPSYHAYDNQGRPVEIDVDEVHGGAYAGHGTTTAPGMQEHGGYRHGNSYNDSRHRPAPVRPSAAPPVKTQAPPMPVTTAQPLSHQSKPSLSSQIITRPAVINGKDREPKRRSMTPNALGPAKGLVAPIYEKMRLQDSQAVAQRPATVSKDFNLGPKVDSEAVYQTLQHISGRDAEVNSSMKPRHLGSFRYDPRKTPLLSGDLLQANVGATLEVRVSGRQLGRGPLGGEKSRRAGPSAWALGWRAREKMGMTEAQEVEDVDGEKDSQAAAADFWNQDALLHRKVWGSDVYTDDSDVVAMCIHAGWIEGPRVQDVPAWVPPGKATFAWRQMTQVYADQGLVGEDYEAARRSYSAHSEDRIQRLHSTADLSVIVRIAPKLIAYKGCQRGGVKSRSWGNGHDGVSLIIESVTLQEAGYASGERGLRNVKHRIDHLARLKTLAAIAMDTTSEERIAKTIQGGGLVDIQMAASMSTRVDAAVKEKPFWMVDVRSGKVEA